MTSQKRSVRLSGLPNSTYIFIIVFVAASIIVPLFFTPGNISTLLTQACALMLLSTAMSVCLMMGGIDLSLGGVVSMTGVIMAMLLRGGAAPSLAILAGLLSGMVVGFLNGVVVTRMKVPSFIATFGMGGIAQSIANTLSEKRTVSWAAPTETNLLTLLGDNALTVQFGDSAAYTLSISVLLVLTIFIIAVVLLLFYRTTLGSNTYALGANEETARLAGISPNRWKTEIYVGAGFLAAIAGMVLMIRTNSLQPMIGENLEFQAVVAAVLGGNSLKGGKGSIPGAILGALTLFTVRNAMSLSGVNTSVVMVVIGCTLIVGMVINEVVQYYAAEKSKARAGIHAL